MDILIAGLVLIVIAIFEPGNVEINEHCLATLKGQTEDTFDSRKQCWDYYHQYRDGIPNTAANL